MNIEEIHVTIDPDGKTDISVKGVAGGGCLDLTQALEKALGGEVDSREMTGEYYQSTRAQNQQFER